MPNYYLTPLEFIKDPELGDWSWCVRDNAPFVDLRNIPDQSIESGTPHGMAFAALDPVSDVTVGAIYLGNNLNDEPVDRVAIEQEMGLASGDIAGSSILDAGFQILTEYADPTGDNLVKPLMPGLQHDGSFEIRLHLRGHSLIKSERYEKVRHPYVEDVLKYRIPFYKLLGTRRSQEEFGALEREYGFKISDIAPGEISRLPGTDKSDTYVEGSPPVDLSSHTATGPDSGFAWSQQTAAQYNVITGNLLERTTGGPAWKWGRADYDFAGNNLNAQIDVINATVERFGGLILRKDNTATATYYYGAWDQWATSTVNMRFRKVLAGSTTTFDSAGNNGYGPATFRVELDAVTDALELLVNSVSESTQTDSAIDGVVVGGKRAGNQSFASVTSGVKGTYDNFTATDGIAVGGVVLGSGLLDSKALHSGVRLVR